MTRGVTSVRPPRPPAAALFRSARYGMLQASFNFEAFWEVICFSGEYRVPDKSWLNIGQSVAGLGTLTVCWAVIAGDRKSTRLNSSHLGISYAVFCLKKKNKT